MLNLFQKLFEYIGQSNFWNENSFQTILNDNDFLGIISSLFNPSQLQHDDELKQKAI